VIAHMKSLINILGADARRVEDDQRARQWIFPAHCSILAGGTAAVLLIAFVLAISSSEGRLRRMAATMDRMAAATLRFSIVGADRRDKVGAMDCVRYSATMPLLLPKPKKRERPTATVSRDGRRPLTRSPVRSNPNFLPSGRSRAVSHRNSRLARGACRR